MTDSKTPTSNNTKQDPSSTNRPTGSSSTSATPTGASPPGPPPFKGPKLGGFTRSPGFKFFLLGFITLLLLLPTLLVWGIVEERSSRSQTVAREISRGWGGEQVLNGPYLAIPYSVEVTQKSGQVEEVKTVIRHVLISAESLEMDASIDVNERRKSIYSTPLYHTRLKLKGRFAPANLKSILAKKGTPDLANAFLVMGISDNSGFRSKVELKLNGTLARDMEPGTASIGNLQQFSPGGGYRTYRNNRNRRGDIGNGVHAPVSQLEAKNGFAFDVTMALNGSRALSVVPAAKNTAVALQSNWPHPGFDGRFLPEQRDITEQGFTAKWTVPYLARGIDAQWFASSLPNTGSIITVNFVEPLKFYQVISRTLKYAIAFFALIFLAVFILELLDKRMLHWIQYILVGLAMVIFYILLLALAEHLGFDLAYAISAIATTVLIAFYVGDTLQRRSGGVIMGAVIGVSYLIIYLVMKEQEFALLAGAIIAFLAIAITMFATRRVDWTGQDSGRDTTPA